MSDSLSSTGGDGDRLDAYVGETHFKLKAGEPFVAAVIELTVPLDGVAIDASVWEKQQAVGDLMEKVIDHLPDEFAEHVGRGFWEDHDVS